jgi:hypothetical protein
VLYCAHTVPHLHETLAVCHAHNSEEIDSIIKTMSNKQFRQTVFASATGQSPVVAEAAERHMKVTMDILYCNMVYTSTLFLHASSCILFRCFDTAHVQLFVLIIMLVTVAVL